MKYTNLYYGRFVSIHGCCLFSHAGCFSHLFSLNRFRFRRKLCRKVLRQWWGAGGEGAGGEVILTSLSIIQCGSCCDSPSGSRMMVWNDLKSVTWILSFSGQTSSLSSVPSPSRSVSHASPRPSPVCAISSSIVIVLPGDH